jgi:hypothetical protein
MNAHTWRQQRCADCAHRTIQHGKPTCQFSQDTELLPHQPACAFWYPRPHYLAPIAPLGPALEQIALQGYVELEPRHEITEASTK